MVGPNPSDFHTVEELRALAENFRNLASLYKRKAEWRPIEEAPKGQRLELWRAGLIGCSTFGGRSTGCPGWFNDYGTILTGVTHFRYPSAGPV